MWDPVQVLIVKHLPALPHKVGKPLPSAAEPRGGQQLSGAWILDRDPALNTHVRNPIMALAAATSWVEAPLLSRDLTSGHCLHLGDDRTSPASMSGTTHTLQNPLNQRTIGCTGFPRHPKGHIKLNWALEISPN